MVADRSGRIETGIEGYGHFEGGMAEQLPEELEGAGIAIENQLGRDMPHLMGRDGETEMLERRPLELEGQCGRQLAATFERR